MAAPVLLGAAAAAVAVSKGCPARRRPCSGTGGLPPASAAWPARRGAGSGAGSARARQARAAARAWAASAAAAPPPAPSAASPALPAAAIAAAARSSSGAPPGPVSSVDFTLLAAAVAELQREWVPAKVEGCSQPDEDTLVLRVRTPARSGHLHLSWHPLTARLCAGASPAAGAADPRTLTFGDVAADALRGLVLVSVALAEPWERVAVLAFAERPGEPPSARLYVEIMGRLSNVILVDATGCILACAYQTGRAQTRVRPLAAGGPYAPPPPAPGASPAREEPADGWRARVINATGTRTADPESGGGPVERGLVRGYRGVSPALARELAAAARVNPDAAADTLPDAAWAALHSQWLRWVTAVETGTFTPGRWAGGVGQLSAIGGERPYVRPPLAVDNGPGASAPTSGAGPGGAASPAASSVCEMLDIELGSAQFSGRLSSLRQDLLTRVRAAIKRVDGKVAGFVGRLADAADAGTVRDKGDLLIANLHLCVRGAVSAEVPTWEGTGTVTLALDPAKTALEVAQGLYRRAGKLGRTEAAVQPLLADAREEVEYLRQVEITLTQLNEFRTAADCRALEDVRAELIAAKYVKPPAGYAASEAAAGWLSRVRGGEAATAASGGGKAASSGKKGAKGGGAAKGATGGGGKAAAAPGRAAAGREAVAEAAGTRRFVSPSGYEIVVGRNNRGNDHVSHAVARPGDAWMHVQGAPGCHLVLRLPPAAPRPPPQEDLQAAADLCAFFSSLRASTTAAVIVCDPKHLRRPRGGRPGMVQVAEGTEKVVWGRPAASAAAVAGETAA